MDRIFSNLNHKLSTIVNKASIVPVIWCSVFVLFSFTMPVPALAQHVYRCINWQGKVAYESDRCPQGWRQDRVYSPTHVDLESGAVRNFVPSTSPDAGGLAPTYGRPMDASGRPKSDALCEPVRAAVNGTRGHRTIGTLQSHARLVSDLCNHSRGPSG